MYACFRLLGYKFKFFVYLALLSCISHSMDIFTLAVKNIRNMHAVSPIQVTDTLHHNDNEFYMKYPYIESNMNSFTLYCLVYMTVNIY